MSAHQMLTLAVTGVLLVGAGLTFAPYLKLRWATPLTAALGMALVFAASFTLQALRGPPQTSLEQAALVVVGLAAIVTAARLLFMLLGKREARP